MRIRTLSILLLLAAACAKPSNPPGQSARGIQRISCSTDADCAGHGGSCASSVCTASNECRTDADCARAELCSSDPAFGGLCAPAGQTPVAEPIAPTPGCSTDADCPAQNSCLAGQCQAQPPPPPACTRDADCSGGQICSADGNCVPNPWACNTDADCDARGGYSCTNGQCGPTQTFGCNGSNCACNAFTQDCPHGLRCYPWGPAPTDGQCYGQGQKRVGEACIEPPLEGPDACASGLVCAYASENDPRGICLSLCATDTDCSSGEHCQAAPAPTTGTAAQWGLCLAATPPPPPPPACSSDADCASGQVCQSGACVTGSAACRVDADCARGQVCTANRCS